MLQKQSKRKSKKIADRLSIIFLGLILSIGIIGYIQASASTEGVDRIAQIANIQGNSLVAVSNPSYVSEEEETRDRNIALLLDEIIDRESGGNPEICNRDSCSYGRGLCQFTASTWNSTMRRMSKDKVVMENHCWQYVGSDSNKDHPIFDEGCHLIACEWLLREDGIRHWDSNGGDWGSGPYNLANYDLLELSR